MTSYTYDKKNRVTRIDYPGGVVASEQFGYDDTGNLLWKSDGNNAANAVTLYRYDGLNRLTHVYYNYDDGFDPLVYPETADVTYGYLREFEYETGSSLQKTSMTDSTSTSYYWYDLQGRLVRYVPSTKSQAGPNDYVVACSYNNLATQPLSDITYNVSYDYFANGWLRDVKSGANTIATYAYDEVGNRTTTTNNGNGTSTEFAYSANDPRYPLTSITHKHGTQTLATLGYPSRDNVGNPLSMSDWTGSWAYTYDSMSRLDSATLSGVEGPPNPIPDQPCGGDDWVGNRLNPPSGANHMVYNNADQLTSWPGMHTDTYYNDGSLHEAHNTKSPTPDLIASYTYTPTGLLHEASYGGRTLTNTWDADSNRVGIDANGTDYTFVYDATAGIPAVIEEVKDGEPDVVVYYIREPGGALIARTQGATTSYYHFDELGSTRLLTNGSGAVTDRYAYHAYGALVWHGREEGSIDQPYQFVGAMGYYTHYQEPSLGLLQLGVRFYDPETGRFTQKDPIMDGLDFYAYVGGHTLVGIDPSGLCFSDRKNCGYDDTRYFNHWVIDGKRFKLIPFSREQCQKWFRGALERCADDYACATLGEKFGKCVKDCRNLQKPAPTPDLPGCSRRLPDVDPNELADLGQLYCDVVSGPKKDPYTRYQECKTQVKFDLNRCLKHSHDPIQWIDPGDLGWPWNQMFK